MRERRMVVEAARPSRGAPLHIVSILNGTKPAGLPVEQPTELADHLVTTTRVPTPTRP